MRTMNPTSWRRMLEQINGKLFSPQYALVSSRSQATGHDPGIAMMFVAASSIRQNALMLENKFPMLLESVPSNGRTKFGSGVTSSIPCDSSSKEPSMVSCSSNTATKAGTGSPQSLRRSRVSSSMAGRSAELDMQASSTACSMSCCARSSLRVFITRASPRGLSGLRRTHSGIEASMLGSSIWSDSGSSSYHSRRRSRRSRASR